jgi:hypothetical protein
VALVVSLVVMACSGGDDAADPIEERTQERSEEGVAAAETVVASRDLIEAFRDERNLASLNLMGLTDLVDGSIEDNDEARSRSDAVLADLESTVVALDVEAESAFRPMLDAAADLDTLRSEIDSRPGPPSMAEADYANGVFGRYSEVIDSLLEVDLAAEVVLDDPDLRRGTGLFARGLQQDELTERAFLVVVQGAMSDGQHTSAWGTEVASLHAQLEEGQAGVEELAADSDYEATAERLGAELEAAGFLAKVSEILATGDIDIAAVLDSMNTAPDEGWPGFLDRVERILTEQLG